jgi:hypothetical protein
MKLTTHLHPLPRSRMVELYLHSSIRLHAVVLNYLSTGIIYLYFIKQEAGFWYGVLL